MARYPAKPALDCDIIMKGGVTSGVVYPLAVCRLAQVYRLRSVGGASAGSIAAAAAAAAEFGRASGGFEKLEKLPTGITTRTADGRSLLFGLFQPTARTAGLFRVYTSGIGKKGLGLVLTTLGALVRSFPLPLLIGALPGLVLFAGGFFGSGVARWCDLVAGVLLIVLGGAVGAAVGVTRRLGSAVPANGFGVCTGMPGPGAFGRNSALTPWLHGILQDMAGRTAQDAPLTFRDLDSRGCELRMMTTNLTRRQPIAMPWSDHEYFFDPVEFAELFPASLVKWMQDNPPRLPDTEQAQWLAQLRRAQALTQARPLYPLPTEDLPIVVAARLSLSFPFLISAVPLHAVDESAPANQAAHTAAVRWHERHGAGTLERAADDEALRPTFGVNWFSDGGICSNLPVHFFDRSLPTRPTFAIDLAPFPPQHPESASPADDTYLPDLDSTGRSRRWGTWSSTGLGSLAGFAGGILDSARSWVDESQAAMPGYQDRIVTVYLSDTEGGLNLDMDPTVVQHLAERGAAGAGKLVDHFAGSQPGLLPAKGWQNQRWIRFRTATAGLNRWLVQFTNGYTTQSAGTTPYRDLAGPDATAPMPDYPLTPANRAAVNERTAALLGLAGQWAEAPADAFTAGAPEPAPALQLVPNDWVEQPARPPQNNG